jgi:hypothetical protein
VNDEQLRALVRAAVARHLGRGDSCESGSGREPARETAVGRDAAAVIDSSGSRSATRHASHHLYFTLVNAGDACVIEPSVPCDHCGYCKSHGH